MATSTGIDFFTGLSIGDFIEIAKEVEEIGRQNKNNLRAGSGNRR